MEDIINNRNLEGKTEIITIFWVGTFLMLFLTFGLIVITVTYQRHFFKLKKDEAEGMLKACMDTEKQERHRIAADLHDSVLGDLGAIKNYIGILKKSGMDSNSNAEILNEIMEGVEGALENTRNISYNLMPPLLQTQGIVATLDNYWKRLSKKTGICFTVQPVNNNMDIEPEVSYHIFRIIQELTTNMIKYATITKAEIFINNIENITSIIITDNGIPFNFTSALSKSSGNGLRNIASRLQIIGATLLHENSNGINTYTIALKK